MKHIVGFSGGIDSQACARWVLNRYPKEDVILLNSTAGGWEHPLTVKFVAEYSESVHPVVTVEALWRDLWETVGAAEDRGKDGNAPLSFVELAAWKHRFPSRKAQFCTEYLKLRPQRRWVRENVADDYRRYTGNRREESKARRLTAFETWDDFFDCLVMSPCADWTKQMCFDYVKAHSEPINPLYSMGFNRVGCSPCINETKDGVLNWSMRDESVIDKVRDAERVVGGTFFPPNMIPTAKIAYVDDVVEWSKTTRGGRQPVFPIFHEREACESKYGLCE